MPRHEEKRMLLNAERAIEVMERHGLDALVATNPENVYYLSDFGAQHPFTLNVVGISAAILPKDENLPATLIVADMDVPYLAEQPSWMPELRMMKGVEAYIPPGARLTKRERRVRDLWASLESRAAGSRHQLIVQVLRELGLQKASLGFDDLRVLAELAESELCDAKTKDTLNIMREIRVVKTEEEIQLLREAARINEVALQSLINVAVEGASMAELARTYRIVMAAQGAVGIEVPLGGLDRPWQTVRDTSYILKRGDHMNIDVAGSYKHYWSDTARTVYVGVSTLRVRELFQVIEECHAAVTPLLAAGTSVRAVIQEAREVVGGEMTAGFMPVIHSIGVEIYDQPSTYGAIYSDDFQLEKNMVVNFETPYCEWPWGTLQLENTYLIGGEGPTKLTTLPNGPLVSA
jgi:Xaa-Pro dipeptidase